MIEFAPQKRSFGERMSSDFEKFILVNSEFDNARMAQDRSFQRMLDNHKMYFGIEGGQYTGAELDQLKREQRHADTYNIVGPKIDTLAGSIAANGFDVDLKPIAGPRNSVHEAERDSFAADKELCDYQSHKNDVILDGMIHSGEIKMTKTFKFDNSMGNICFVRCMPGFVIRDPHWISKDDNDCKKLWEVFHLSAGDIAQKYNVYNEIIDNQIRMTQRMGGEYRDISIHADFTQSVQRSQKGHMHRVVEYHYMEDIQTTRLQGQVLNSTRWVVFPITKDRVKLEQFMIQNKVDPNTMADLPYRDSVHKVVAICPTLMPKGVLTEGTASIQCKRLPYFHLTSNRSGGVDKGVVDDIADIQMTINKREMKTTELIGTATGGGKLVSRDLFRTPEELRKFKAGANDPRYVGVVDGDALKDNPIHYLNMNQYPSTIIDQINRMYDIVDRVSKVPAAMEAMSESANESGILFDRKLQVAQLGLITINNSVKKWEKDMAEAYMVQWQLDPGYNSWEREMSTSDGKNFVILNEMVTKNGEMWVRNRPQDLPRSTVVITESKNNPTKRLQDRAFYQDLYNFAVQNNPNSIYVSYLFAKILDTMEMTESDKVEFDLIKKLQNKLDLSRVETEIDNLNATSAQSALVELQSLMEAESLKGGGGGQEELPVSEVPQSEMPIQPDAEPIPEAEQSTIPQPGPASP